MIVVTGGAGFIGAAVARRLVARNEPVAVVDPTTDPAQWNAIADLRFEKLGFNELISELGGSDSRVRAVVHQGAISSTTHSNHDRVLANNLTATRRLLSACAGARIPLVYASSAAVYGSSSPCREAPAYERPLATYGWSKLLVDAAVRRLLEVQPTSVVGLRCFNVYGPGEEHKGTMSSMVRQLDDQVMESGTASLFGAGAGCGPGEHRRDFVHVDDVVATIMWFLDHPNVSGIFNCGTGVSRSFNELATAVINQRGTGKIRYVDFPWAIERQYQADTKANLDALHGIGCDQQFRSIDEGISAYLEWRDTRVAS